MKTKRLIFNSLFIISLIFSVVDGNAQRLYMANVQKSDLKVKGTSTLHDWHMNAENFDCAVKASNAKNKLIIQKVSFSCNTNSLKSENSIMDKKAWDALKAKDFKTIHFESNELNEFSLQDKKVEGKFVGELDLSGVKRKIIIPFKGEVDELGNYKITGEIAVKMSEFGIEAPTALMGSIKTGDEIKIVYDINFNQSTAISANIN
jgi:polyisoprenoid-binding protein YceI